MVVVGHGDVGVNHLHILVGENEAVGVGSDDETIAEDAFLGSRDTLEYGSYAGLVERIVHTSGQCLQTDESNDTKGGSHGYDAKHLTCGYAGYKHHNKNHAAQENGGADIFLKDEEYDGEREENHIFQCRLIDTVAFAAA